MQLALGPKIAHCTKSYVRILPQRLDKTVANWNLLMSFLSFGRTRFMRVRHILAQVLKLLWPWNGPLMGFGTFGFGRGCFLGRRAKEC